MNIKVSWPGYEARPAPSLFGRHRGAGSSYQRYTDRRFSTTYLSVLGPCTSSHLNLAISVSSLSLATKPSTFSLEPLDHAASFLLYSLFGQRTLSSQQVSSMELRVLSRLFFRSMPLH